MLARLAALVKRIETPSLAELRGIVADAALSAQDLSDIVIAPGDLWNGRVLTPSAAQGSLEIKGFRWKPGATTEIHDHPPMGGVFTSSTFHMAVVAGALRVDLYERVGQRAAVHTEKLLLGPGDCLDHHDRNRPSVHRVSNDSRRDTFTLHIYLPSVEREAMTFYDEVTEACVE